MAVQLVFVMETNSKSKTDLMYIRSLINRVYDGNNKKSIIPKYVYLDGKNNYNNKKIRSQINGLIRNFKVIGDTKVIYFLDTDDYERDYEDAKIVDKVEEFCGREGYELVWFCHDVEEVFWGKRVSNAEKDEYAQNFLRKNQIELVDLSRLRIVNKGKSNSNILRVLDEFYL